MYHIIIFKELFINMNIHQVKKIHNLILIQIHILHFFLSLYFFFLHILNNIKLVVGLLQKFIGNCNFLCSCTVLLHFISFCLAERLKFSDKNRYRICEICKLLRFNSLISFVQHRIYSKVR